MANKVLPQTIDWMLETVNPSAAGVSLRCFVEVTHVPGEVSTRLPVEVMKSFTQACISVCLCLFVYVSIVYGSACRSVLKQLNPIHHQGLWIALGAFRTSPAQSLYIEAHKPSLTTRRLKLSLNYVLKPNPCRKTQPIVVFLNPKSPNYLKNRSQRFHLLASAFFPTWRNPNLT